MSGCVLLELGERHGEPGCLSFLHLLGASGLGFSAWGSGFRAEG